MSRVITILEVSQKQAYIFESSKLKDNITNSAVIAYALSPEYIGKVLAEENGYSDEKNMVYAGGGHTILTFSADNITEAHDLACRCTALITEQAYRDFDGLTIFAKTIAYDESKGVDENLKNLTAALETKKAVRKAAFKKGSFGIERIDAATLKPRLSEGFSEETDIKKKIRNSELEGAVSKRIAEAGYKASYQFENLGGSKDSSNFLAVVHIDGNGMGKRVEMLYEDAVIPEHDFDIARAKLREFSEGIDRDFKDAYDEMLEAVLAEIADDRKLYSELDLKTDRDGKCFFPVRKVITAGDDICFVSEGRIGIECAVKFIEALNKKSNVVDKKGYTACAGVAIVHAKYPFYKAYELAEMLCSHAKSFNATVHDSDNGQGLSSIDWHVEFGEIGDSLEEIREDYIAYDGSRLHLRPYVISGNNLIPDGFGKVHSYQDFKERFRTLVMSSGTLSGGKLKELRGALRKGEDETTFYLQTNLMTDVPPLKDSFITDYDGRKCAVPFDVIELMDSYLPFEN